MWSIMDMGTSRSEPLHNSRDSKRTSRNSDVGQPLGLIENPLFEGGGGGNSRFGSGASHSAPVSRQTSEQPVHPDRRSNMSRPVRRSKTVKEYVIRGTESFFGLNVETEHNSHQTWTERRRRLLTKRYGELKDGYNQPLTPMLFLQHGDQPTQSHQYSTYASRQNVPLGTDDGDGSSRTAAVVKSSSLLLRNKDSVYKMTWDGVRFLTQTAKKRWSQKSRPSSLPGRQFSYAASDDDSVFYDDNQDQPGLPKTRPLSEVDNRIDEVFFDKVMDPGPSPSASSISRHNDSWFRVQQPPLYTHHLEVPRQQIASTGRPTISTWHCPSTDVVDSGKPDVGMRRIWNRILEKSFDNSNRRQYGMGVVGKLFHRRFRRDRMTPEVRQQLADIDDYRPYFTYWVTTVQVLITLITLAVYGFGPWGFSRTQRSSLVLVTSLSLQQVDYFEPDNFWIGPRSADLVHLGAKFTPCMRKDRHVFEVIKKDRVQERNTACCVRNDQSGCVQTTRDKCSEIISTWRKWDPRQPGPPRWIADPKQFHNKSGNHRLSGSVCGQDPRYCEEPASVFPYEWPDDITKWPVCRRTIVGQKASEAHMTCEVIGRPCCIGVYGECRITTKEYCDFVKGFFHEEAALCSQVTCLDDVCGMIPFYNPDVPDQFYRLWTSLFLHAGIIHLAITVIVQYFIMRDVEKLVGPVRMGIVYMMSGVSGNLASAIFVPYRGEVGPAGSQFGLLACLFVEVIHCWQMLRRPGMALLRLGAVALVLFLVGTLPWVDNYAHIFGFIFGFMLSYALLPFVSFGTYDKTTKKILIWVCLIVIIVLFIGLLVLFYVNPIYECSFCKYLNCIPFTRDFCANQEIIFTRPEY